MQQVELVSAIAGIGLANDRYALGLGAWQRTPGRGLEKHVTFIEAEAIEKANAMGGEQFLFEETRRNIVTRGVRLSDLVGRTFMVGGIAMRGVELADPCPRPSTLAKKADKQSFAKLFAGMGGLRCAILSSGTISQGDQIAKPHA